MVTDIQMFRFYKIGLTIIGPIMLNIVAREAWCKTEPTRIVPYVGMIENVFLAYSRSDPCQDRFCRTLIRQEQYRQMGQRGQTDLLYNFMISGDGMIYECRGFSDTPMLPNKYRGLSRRSLYIVLMGRFYDQAPSDAMFQVREDFIQYCIKHHIVRKFYREFVI